MKTLKLELETRTVIRVLIIITGFILALLLLKRIALALELIGIAFFLSLALNPAVSAVARHIPIVNPRRGRVVATGIAYLIVLLILGTLLVSIIPALFRQTTTFMSQTIPMYVSDLQQKSSPVSEFISKYHLQGDINKNIDSLKNNASQIAGYLVGRVGEVTGSIVKILSVLALTFLMLIEGPRWQKRVWSLYSDPELLARHKALGMKMYHVVTGYVNGQVIIAAIAGAATLVVVLVLSLFFSIPSGVALPMAGIIFVTGLIPMIGATIGASLVTLFLLLYSIPAALIFLAYFIAHQQFENYVIHPMIQSHTINLSPLAVFMAALIGFYLLGPIGGFIAIPIAGCLNVLLLDYIHNHNILHEQEEEREEKKVDTAVET
jgi:predicted PurR-regulated permease PerM